ncbi:F-box/WD repeat-containing protein pof1 [Lasiodiplodia hormozganensis]|uniref:F-box/WD repeat-containing protein pof1 n=1 Tax=Lasiodiplodia hormozganensis TaxID=869390 RepID=A0AA39Y7N8_9PEZI|nr:F-box/WD repeat-containing protein pof1 [Lasiodiplodia hormozganensis]
MMTAIKVVAQEPITFPHPSHASEEGHTADIYSIAVSANHLISCSRDRTIRIWNLSDHRLAHPPLREHASSVLCCKIHEESDLFVTSEVDGFVELWRLSTAQLVKKWKAHADSVLSLALGGEVLVTGSRDKSIKAWSVAQLLLSSRAEAAGGDTTTADVDDDDNTAEPEPLRTIGAATAAVNDVALAADEKSVFAGSGDGSLRQWYLSSSSGDEKPSRDFESPGGGGGGCRRRGICSLSLTRNGKRLVSGHSDGKLRVFDVERATELMCIDAHGTCLTRSVCTGEVDKATGGREEVVLSGSYDGTVKVWMEREEGKWESVAVMRFQQEMAIPANESPTDDNRILSVALSENMVFYCGQSPYIFGRRIEHRADAS